MTFRSSSPTTFPPIRVLKVPHPWVFWMLSGLMTPPVPGQLIHSNITNISYFFPSHYSFFFKSLLGARNPKYFHYCGVILKERKYIDGVKYKNRAELHTRQTPGGRWKRQLPQMCWGMFEVKLNLERVPGREQRQPECSRWRKPRAKSWVHQSFSLTLLLQDGMSKIWFLWLLLMLCLGYHHAEIVTQRCSHLSKQEFD